MVNTSMGSTAAAPPPPPSSDSKSGYITNHRFADLSISAESRRGVNEVLGYEFMTKVQAETLPVILQGIDVLAKAKTGACWACWACWACCACVRRGFDVCMCVCGGAGRGRRRRRRRLPYQPRLLHSPNQPHLYLLPDPPPNPNPNSGTGKTLGFLIPSVEVLLSTPVPPPGPNSPIRVLILSPTRELAAQISVEGEKLCQYQDFRFLTVVGGKDIKKDQRAMNNGRLDFLVATPGRLIDHLENTRDFAYRLQNIHLFILDEADQMLDMGFKPALDKIMTYLPNKQGRQTLLFSATVPPSIQAMGPKFLRQGYQYIDTVGEEAPQTHDHVPQELLVTPLEMQVLGAFELLAHATQVPNHKIIVFFSTARVTGECRWGLVLQRGFATHFCNAFLQRGFETLKRCHARPTTLRHEHTSSHLTPSPPTPLHPTPPLHHPATTPLCHHPTTIPPPSRHHLFKGLFAEFWTAMGRPCFEIHSRKSQPARDKASNAFRASTNGAVMFTSDVTARGLDYPDVTFVLQVGLTTKEQYIHRLGRTARAGKGGKGLLLLADFEARAMASELRTLPIKNSTVVLSPNDPSVNPVAEALNRVYQVSE